MSRRRSRSSNSSGSRSERRKTVEPNPAAILVFQSTESDGIFTVLYQQDSTSAGIYPPTGRVGPGPMQIHYSTYCTHTHPNPHTHPHPLYHTHHPLIIRIIPLSYASSSHHPHHPLIKLIVLITRIVLVVLILLILSVIMGFWSLLYETNHPFQFALGSRAHGCCAARESSRSWGFRPGRRGQCFVGLQHLIYLLLQRNT